MPIRGIAVELADVMRSQHACRYYQPDPVPEQVFYNAVEAARFGPQGGNRQPVRFLIVTDPAKKAQLAEWYRVPWKAYLEAATVGQESIQAESGVLAAEGSGQSNGTCAKCRTNRRAWRIPPEEALSMRLARHRSVGNTARGAHPRGKPLEWKPDLPERHP